MLNVSQPYAIQYCNHYKQNSALAYILDYMSSLSARAFIQMIEFRHDGAIVVDFTF